MEMIKTFKVKHGVSFEPSLFEKAIKVAQYALENGLVSTKAIKHIGLKSEIANQIVRKYGLNKKIKSVNPKKVKLTVPGQNLKFDAETRKLRIPSLKVEFRCWFPSDWTKLNQVEIDKTWAYVSVTFPDQQVDEPKGFIGIDLNSTSHSIVVANPQTGKIKKFGKQIPFLKKKYKNIRQNLQEKKQWSQLKKIKDRERRKTTDTIHKITTTIVKEAKKSGVGIKLEDLSGIRKDCTKKYRKQGNHTLNSWPFYQVRMLLTYKAKEQGVELNVVDPAWTSTSCSRCGVVDKESRNGKVFHCLHCEHIDHADVNAAFNIALRLKIDPVKKEIRRKGRRTAKPSELKSLKGKVDEGKTTLEPYGLVP
jgi:putative transposase